MNFMKIKTIFLRTAAIGLVLIIQNGCSSPQDKMKGCMKDAPHSDNPKVGDLSAVRRVVCDGLCDSENWVEIPDEYKRRAACNRL